MNTINYKQFLYPPGGILIWIIIIVEVVTFGAGIIAFAWQRNSALEIFNTSQKTLNTSIGFVNTLFLLTSGFFVAEAARYLKLDNMQKSRNLMRVAMLFGFAFLFLKGIEYYGKIEHGLDLTHNTFYTFYWLLTGFHFLHVSVGLVLLTSVSYFFSGPIGAKPFLYIIVILTLVKVFWVALQYMELKKANRTWLFILAFVLVVYAGSVVAFYS